MVTFGVFIVALGMYFYSDRRLILCIRELLNDLPYALNRITSVIIFWSRNVSHNIVQTCGCLCWKFINLSWQWVGLTCRRTDSRCGKRLLEWRPRHGAHSVGGPVERRFAKRYWQKLKISSWKPSKISDNREGLCPAVVWRSRRWWWFIKSIPVFFIHLSIFTVGATNYIHLTKAFVLLINLHLKYNIFITLLVNYVNVTFASYKS